MLHGAVNWHADVQATTTTHSSVKFRIDTGADVTVLPDRFFSKSSPLIQKRDKKLFVPGESKINVLGRVCNHGSRWSFIRPRSLCCCWLERATFGKTCNWGTEIDRESQCSWYMKEFPELFTGLGRMKNDYTIRLQENAPPFAITAPRRLPLPMKGKVQEELKKLEEQDIIRPVETPTDWCAPIMAVPKPNRKVWLCINFMKLSESVCRETFPLPTTDHLLAQLDGATVFTKLDCNSGFHQEMTCILEGKPGVICDINDVLGFGSNQQEHDSRLRIVLLKIKEAGVTLNEKCKFSIDCEVPGPLDIKGGNLDGSRESTSYL